MRPLLLLVLVSACAPHSGASDFDVTASSDPDPAIAGADVVWSLDLRRTESGAAVEGADVSVTPWMPSMGHGITATPEVTEVGGGRYETSFLCPMSGTWELRVHVVTDDAEADEVVSVEVE